MTRFSAWVQASRPLAQISVAVPLVYGQALAFAAHGAFRFRIFLLVHLFGLADQLFVVYANDVADVATDVHNTTYNRYSGGSRVVAEGKLGPLDLARAATLALLTTATVSAYLVFREHRAFMVVIAAIAAHLMWMYSFPPFRMSYRGYGELLQGVGLGVLLPVAGFYAQAGTLDGLGAAALVPGFLLGSAGNIVAALADAPSDAASGKRTLPVRRGERAARRTALALVAAALVATPLAAPSAGVVAWAFAAAAGAGMLVRAARRSGGADSVDRVRCERFTGSVLATISVLILAWSAVLVANRLAGRPARMTATSHEISAPRRDPRPGVATPRESASRAHATDATPDAKNVSRSGPLVSRGERSTISS